MLLSLLALHEQHLADGIVDGRDGEVAVVEFLAYTSVDIHIPANDLNGIERTDPPAQFGILAE